MEIFKVLKNSSNNLSRASILSTITVSKLRMLYLQGGFRVIHRGEMTGPLVQYIIRILLLPKQLCLCQNIVLFLTNYTICF